MRIKLAVLWLFVWFVGFVAFGQNPQSQTAPLYAVNAKYTNGVAPGYAPTAGMGLTLNLGPGTANCLGSIETYSGGTLTMTASTTNYVYLNTAASCVPAVKTTSFTASDIPLATTVASGTAITSISDDRTPFSVSGATGSSSALVKYASQSSCHLNSNVNSGGGTSDTTCIQTGLNALSAAGGGTWVQDGASLIDATNANGTTQWSALALPSNVTILCPSQNQGFYLANSSNVMMISNKNVTGNPAATFDTNMRVSGCTWNGNGSNQSRWEQGNSVNGWVQGMYFASFNGLTIDNTVMMNARTFAYTVANGTNYTFRDNVCTWNAGGGQSSAPTTTGNNHDCLHLWGPLSNVYAHNTLDHWGDDDGIAINTNEECFAYYQNVYWGAARFPWCSATPGVTAPSGAVNITNLYIDGFTFDSTAHGVRWIAYSGGNWGTSTGSVSGVTLTNLAGTFSDAPMNNGCSDSQPNCAALTSPGPITIDKWYVTGSQNGLNLPSSSSLQLSDIIAGASINTNLATQAQQYPGSGTTTNALTMNNGGAGAASGSTFNGSAAKTLSYNTIGAAPAASPTFTGTFTTPITGGGMQCLHVNNSGVLSGTGSDCGGAFTATDISSIMYVLDSGAANAYVATLSPAIASYTTGLMVRVKIANTNTTTTPTLNVNGLGTKTITKNGAAAVAVGDVAAGQIQIFQYDGTEFQLLNPATGSTVFAATTPLTVDLSVPGTVTYKCPTCSTGSGGTAISAYGGSSLGSTTIDGISPWKCLDTSGSGTAQTCSTSTSFTVAANACVLYSTATTNSGTGLTVNVNSLGAKSIAVPGSGGWSTTLTAGAVPANKPLMMCYDGTNWNVQQTGSTSSASYKQVASGGTTTTMSFTSIAAGAQGNMKIRCHGRSSASSANDYLKIVFNSDTANDYFDMFQDWDGTAGGGSPTDNPTMSSLRGFIFGGNVAGNTAPANTAGSTETTVDGYTESTFTKVATTLSGNMLNTNRSEMIVMQSQWLATPQAITRVDISLGSGLAFVDNSQCTIDVN